MKEKLKKFKLKTGALLPHEITLLFENIQTIDEEKLDILKRIKSNALHPDQPLTFDKTIDKRKYSYLLLWIESQLKALDVDAKLKWILELKHDILTDSIIPTQESKLLKTLTIYDGTSYYFMNYYEMLVEYRHFLLIRMRYTEYNKVIKFLENFKYHYNKSKLVNDQMQQSTVAIAGSSNQEPHNSINWKEWLAECLNDTTLDGLNRYMASVRLSFICLHYNLPQELDVVLKVTETFFSSGKYYSKRLLLNFYNNMLVLYDKKGDLEMAKYYGYLSLKGNNQDAIVYINNFVNVLIKAREYQVALRIIESNAEKAKATTNFHSIIGFNSNQIRCLSKTGKNIEAITKGRIFLDAYQKKVMNFRWHRFFAAYLGALLVENKLIKIIQLVSKYSLLEKEQNAFTQKSSSKIISIYYHLASYQEGRISKKEISDFIKNAVDNDISSLDVEIITYINDLKILGLKL